MINSTWAAFGMILITVGVFCFFIGLARYLEYRKRKQEKEFTNLWNEISSRNFDIEN